MTTELLEPFDNFTNWSAASAPWSIVAGRTGNCANASTAGNNDHRIPSLLESDTVTMGFAWQLTSTGNRTIVQLLSDTGATAHFALLSKVAGSLEVRRGGPAGTILGTTAATGLIAVNTWYYIEIQVVLSDTVGVITLNIDGVQRLALTAQDTKNAGTKTTFDTVRINGTTGPVTKYDDMYVATGTGETFRGDQHIGAAAMKTWNGSAFVSAPVKVYNGSAFVDAVAVKTWNGSAFV